MSTFAHDLRQLSSAEEFFDYFTIPYDRAVLNVSRLHILKRFNQYLMNIGGIDALPQEAAHANCRNLLLRAYTDFIGSSGIEEKVFRVFHAARGEHRVPIDGLKRSTKETAEQ